MRQAGRFQPEYREIRSKLVFAATTLKPAAQVTLFAVRILASTRPFCSPTSSSSSSARGFSSPSNKGEGPGVQPPVRLPEDVEADPGPRHPPRYGLSGGSSDSSRFPQSKALIGFAGAPFTVASDRIEGGSSRCLNTKRFIITHPLGLESSMQDPRRRHHRLPRSTRSMPAPTPFSCSTPGLAVSSPRITSMMCCRIARNLLRPAQRGGEDSLWSGYRVLFHGPQGSRSVVGVDFVTPLPYARQIWTDLPAGCPPGYLFTDCHVCRQASAFCARVRGTPEPRMGHGIVPSRR